MVLMHIKKSLMGPNVYFKEGNVYFVSEEGMNRVRENLHSKGLGHAVAFYDVYDLYKPYLFGDTCEMLIIRTGGIGDLIAMSSLAAYCWHNTIKFVTSKHLLSVFDWYETNNVYPKAVDEPLYMNFRPVRVPFIQKTTKRVYAEGIIEEGGRENWYAVFFGAIGLKKVPYEFLRPHLVKERVTDKPSHIDTGRKSILISHRSTAQMRSMLFQDIYEPIVKIIGDRDVDIYVHSANCTQQDLDYLKTISDGRVKIIKQSSVSMYLLELFDATVTVSVDSAAVHFREGTGKPGIGIYAAFTTDSRVQFYETTQSFNLKSGCGLQPCFIHQQYKDHVCPKARKGDTEAPCMGSMNKTLQEQIAENSKEYLLNALNN